MLLFLVALAAAAPLSHRDRVSEADLAIHIRVLASDEYEGRKPGTVASSKTLSYIATAFAKAGLKPAAPDGSWYQPVPLVDLAPITSSLRFGGQGGVAIPAADIVAIARREVETFDRTPVVDVAVDAPVPSDIAGKVAVLRLSQTNASALWPQWKALSDAGAKAVLILTPDPMFE